jgi:hypothetical protein
MNTVTPADLPVIVIESEADAYAWLAKLADGEEVNARGIEFRGWPTLNLKLKGDLFDQSLTPTVMKGLIELQQGLYKSYAEARSKKRLTEAERDELEIRVSVKSGSSELEINFSDIATNLFHELFKVLTPTQTVITVLSIAVLYFGNSAWRHWLETRAKTREKEVSDETQRETLRTMRFTSEQETKRTEIITKLAAREPTVKVIEHIADESRNSLVKSTIRSDQTSIAGDIKIDSDKAHLVTGNPRRQGEQVRLDGYYRLVKLDWTNPLHFKVKAIRQEDHLEIDATVQDDTLTGRTKDALKAAEWSRKLIHLEVNARQFGPHEYRDAVVLSATSPLEPSLAP